MEGTIRFVFRGVRRRPMVSLAMGWVLLMGAPAHGNDAPASDESIRELLAITRSDEVFSSLKPQFDAAIASSIKDVSRGGPATPERQAVIDRMRQKMVAAFGDTFNAASLELVTIRVYQATYTESEVEGLIAFYKTPAGQALTNKKALMMQNMMDEMRVMMRPLNQRMVQIRTDAQAEMKALPAVR